MIYSLEYILSDAQGTHLSEHGYTEEEKKAETELLDTCLRKGKEKIEMCPIIDSDGKFWPALGLFAMACPDANTDLTSIITSYGWTEIPELRVGYKKK